MLSCHGGEMETKFRLRLNTQYDDSTVYSALFKGFIYEYTYDLVRDSLAELSLYEKNDILNGLQVIKNNSQDVAFVSLQDWIKNKDTAQTDVLTVAAVIDARLAQENKGVAGEFTENIAKKIQEYINSLSGISLQGEVLDIGDTGINADYIDKVITQIALVSENEFLVGLSALSLNPVPLETKAYTNKFIEEKLNKLNGICDKLSQKLSSDYDSLQNMVADLNDELYKISNESVTDGEKVDMARKAIKAINPHRQLVDKVEDKLVEATEFARQLTIHEGKIKAADDAKLASTDINIKNAASKDAKVQAERDFFSMKFMNDQYLNGIAAGNARVKAIKEGIEEYRKILDSLEVAFKSAIPTEAEMKKYSSVKHRFQDLQNRLEVSASQLVKKDKALKELIDAAKAGLEALTETYTEGKDLFMRNNLMTAVFATVTCLYNLTENEDRDIEKAQKKFVSERLEDYSIRNSSLLKDLTTFRRVGDEAIRDIAIVLGKPLSTETLYEMLEIQELAINQSNQMFDMLDKNHQKQLDLLTTILSME